MNVREHFLRMFAYDSWANRECLSSLRKAAGASPATLRRMAHILSAERLWLERLRGERQSMAVWPAATLVLLLTSDASDRRFWAGAALIAAFWAWHSNYDLQKNQLLGKPLKDNLNSRR